GPEPRRGRLRPFFVRNREKVVHQQTRPIDSPHERTPDVKSFTSKAISTAATCFTALCVVFTSLSMTAPAAHAASSVQLSTNVKSFIKVHSGDLRIRVNADRGTGARVYINGKAAQFKKLGRDGEVLFTLGR